MKSSHVSTLFGQLRQHDLTKLEQRFLAAVQRDEVGSTVRDGYPSGGVGSGGEDAPQSSTEASALTNLGVLGRPAKDPFHEQVVAAGAKLADAVANLNALAHRLDLVDALSDAPKAYDPSGACVICGRHVEGTAVDRLRRGMCETDHKAWTRAGRPEVTEFKRTRKAVA